MTPRNQAIKPSRRDLAGKISATSRTAGYVLAIAILVLSLVPPTLRPQTGLPHDLEHFGIFRAMGAAFALGFGEDYVGLVAWLVIFAGGVVENAQCLYRDGMRASAISSWMRLRVALVL